MYRRRPLTRGFTLIELVMSLSILGLIAAAVIWTLPDRRSEAEAEAIRLAARLQVAADESVLSGEIVGLTLQPTQYTFNKYRRGTWVPVSRDSVLQGRTLSSGLTAYLLVDGSAPPIDPVRSVFGASTVEPQVLLHPITQNEPFTIVVNGADGAAQVEGRASGQFEVVRDED